MNASETDPELAALATVYACLKELDADSQRRVLDYVALKLGLPVTRKTLPPFEDDLRDSHRGGRHETTEPKSPPSEQEDDTDGISPIAVKWMRRSGFTIDQLGKLFSLGTAEIDLVAKKVPGASRSARVRNVTLLKGIAAYLGSGAARVTDEQIKEACIHYDAYDQNNHAKYLKGIVSELSGSKSGGYVLTARGITSGTELIKEMLGIEKTQ